MHLLPLAIIAIDFTTLKFQESRVIDNWSSTSDPRNNIVIRSTLIVNESFRFALVIIVNDAEISRAVYDQW